MIRNRIVASAFAFAGGVAIAALPALAATTDYKFELVGKPQLSAHKDIVQVRLVHVADGKPVPDAVIFESKADMGPEGMATMGAPVKALNSIAAPAASIIPSMTSRNTSGSSFSTNRLAMKAPAMSEEPAIRPCTSTSPVSAPNCWNVTDLLT